jgi:hypothetical protein
MIQEFTHMIVNTHTKLPFCKLSSSIIFAQLSQVMFLLSHFILQQFQVHRGTLHSWGLVYLLHTSKNT